MSKKKSSLKKLEKAGERLSGVVINEKDPKKRELHLKLLGVAKLAKKKGIT